MANRYWIGDAGVGGDIWSNPNAWSGASGGAPVGAIPVAGDDVFFDNLSVRDCVLDMNVAGANSISTLDFTGYAQTFTQTGFHIHITGLLLSFDAGMTFNTNAASIVYLDSVAGVTAITCNGKNPGSIIVGNAGAGGTYQQQDFMHTLGYLQMVNGTWDTNNAGLQLNGSLNVGAAVLAGAFIAHADTVEILQNINVTTIAAWLTQGTSTFSMTGNGTIQIPAGGADLVFYDLNIAIFGSHTNFDCQQAGAWFTVTHQFFTNGGASTYAGVGNGLRVISTLVNAFQPTVPGALDIPITLDPQAIAGSVIAIPAHNNAGAFTLLRDVATYGTCTFQLTGAVACGTFLAYSTGGGVRPTLDLNANNLTVTGTATFGNGANGFGLVSIGAATMTVSGALAHLGNPNVDSRIFYMLGGQLLVGGSFTHTGAVATVGQRIDMSANSLVRVGGSWNTTAAVVFSPVVPGDTSGVEFTAAGAFAIACAAAEIWPTVTISGGGTVTLPNPFVCYDLVITAGVVTAGASLTVLNALNNAGTLTGGANMYVGSSFVNSGVLVMAGVNLHLTGGVCSVAGFNPVTLTMERSCQRLQFLASLNITTAFIVADRPVPGVVQFLAGGNFTFAALDSQVVSPDGTVQFVSSAAGTRYNLTLTAITSKQNVWPRDCNYAGAAFAGDLTNRDLGNNLGMVLNFPPAFMRVITEDPGQDLLASGFIGPMNYCWLVATSQAALAALAAAFAGGANNWHRKTNIPLAFLDNLVLGSNYWIGLGLVDDRNNRVAPNIAAGDFATGVAISGESGGGGSHNIHVNVQIPCAS